MVTRFLVASSLVTQMIWGALAQQPKTSTIGPPPPPPIIQQQPQRPDADDVVKITTNLVQVDAVITDKSGKAVTNLKPEEIEISEDGKRQAITHFSYNATAAKGAQPVQPSDSVKDATKTGPIPAPVLQREDVRRSIAVVVDDLGMSFESTSYVRRALKKFVDEQMQPGDLVAIIRTGGGVGALQQFTSDKRPLYAAIDRVKFNLMGRGNTSAVSALRAPDLKIPGEVASKLQTPENFLAEIYSVGTLGTLRYVVQGLRDLPGRKSVLLLSDDLKIFRPGDSTGTNRVQVALEALTDLANRASVVIYTMDARGLTHLGLQAQDNVQLSAPVGRPGMGGPIGGTRSIRDLQTQMAIRRESFYESQNGLNFLAQQTGGLAIRNTNNLSGGIQRVLDDQRGYYLIGYRPDESTFDQKTSRPRFHNLSLKVTRPGSFNVRMRNGFFGVTDEEIKPAPKSAAQLLLSAINSPFAASAVHMQLTSLFANDATNGSYMRSLLYIDPRDLAFKEAANGTHECVFDLLAMTFGDNGVVVDYVAKTYTLQLPEAEYQRAMQQGLIYNVAVPLKKPGAYQFRMALRDTATDRVGSAGQFIAVPNLSTDQLALSGIVLSGAAAPGREKQELVGQNGNVGFGNDPKAGPAVRHFRQGMFLEFGLLIYNARLDRLTQKPQLTTQVRLLRDGQQVFAGSELPFDPKSQTDLGRLSVSGALQLGTDLPPGEYVFQIIVTDALAEKKYRTTTQWMDFEIVK